MSDAPIIQFIDVHKYFKALHVLRGVNLSVNKGEKIVLMGPSGCGKSSLLRCINALETFERGDVIVNGTSLKSVRKNKTFNLNRFRANIGMVFQQFNLFPHLTVLENVTLAPVKVLGVRKAEAETEAHALLKQVGIADKWQVYPEQLSGGQKQRVAIARSLAMKPEMILLDEPTSALDPPMTREVLKVIHNLAEQGMTLLVVTHECHFAQQIADRIVFMDQGQITEEGSPQTVMASPKTDVAKAYFENLL